MAPKTKKAAPKEAPAAAKKGKGKGSKKAGGGGGEENGTEKPQAGRQSKRNVDKVVVYKEVAENVDEKASESQPRKVVAAKPKAKRKHKKAKRTHGSDSEESDSSDEENSDDQDFKPAAVPKPKVRVAVRPVKPGRVR